MGSKEQAQLRGRPARAGLHYFALLTVCATFVLIIAGALVTSNEAGDSVPDWPLSFGRWLIDSDYFRANVRYEYSHRFIAGTVGLLTLALTVWVWLLERRAYVRRVALIALALVVVQALVGGVRVHFPAYKAAIAIPHAFIAQSFLCLLVSLFLFTSRAWQNAGPARPDESGLQSRLLATAATTAIMIQLLLGAAFRHQALGIAPHLVGAVVVTLLAGGTALRVWRRHHAEAFLRRPAATVTVLLFLQVGLGIAAYFARLASRQDPQPLEPMISLTVAHVAVGALTLTAMFVLMLRVYRVLTPMNAPVKLASAAREATT